ncbi:MAG: DUF4266 domain-containing protein [Myxococcota bacterium]
MRLIGRLLILAAIGVCVGGCVRPWQRGALSHRSMDAEQLCERHMDDFLSHVQDIREGATGGGGKPGGGCGCN